jgi:IS5 family transposase
MGEVDQFGRRKKEQFSGLHSQLATMVGRVEQVAKQTRERVFGGNTKFEHKVVSMFEPQTEIIRKGKASKPTEFGKMVKVQEAENQIVTHYAVYDERPADSALLVEAVELHEERLGSVPQIVAADAGFYSQANEKQLEEMGVKNVSVPNRNTRSEQRRTHQKKRSFKEGQRWRTGCEGRISVLKRRHGLNRCRYRGQNGMRRWVGLGVIADNLINMGLCLAK